MSTKIVLVFALVCALAWAQKLTTAQMEALMNHHRECKVETNINDAVAIGVLSGKFPDDPVLKQHMFCIGKRLGVQNDAGEIQTEVVKEKIGKVITDEAKIAEFTEQCSVEKDSPEETAYELAKCIYTVTHP